MTDKEVQSKKLSPEEISKIEKDKLEKAKKMQIINQSHQILSLTYVDHYIVIKNYKNIKKQSLYLKFILGKEIVF